LTKLGFIFKGVVFNLFAVAAAAPVRINEFTASGTS
jgi:hypothetical protein